MTLPAKAGAAWLRANVNRETARGLQPFFDVTSGDSTAATLMKLMGIPSRSIDFPGWLYGASVLYQSFLETEGDRSRQVMSVDASKVHHAYVASIASGEYRHRAVKDTTHFLFSKDDSPIQLTLDLLAPGGDFAGADLAIAHIQRMFGKRCAKGLRHWCAILATLSNQGKRGWARWSLDEHMKMMGYHPKRRANAKTKRENAEEVDLLTKWEVSQVHTDKNGRLRIETSRPVLSILERTREVDGSTKTLSGAILQINPLLYRGVRQIGEGADYTPESTHPLGRNWSPIPMALVSIDHVRFPYAHALGLMLPIRFRWVLAKGGDDRLSLSRESLARALRPGGLRGRGARWEESLKASLRKLEEVDVIGPWTWEDDMLRLSPPQWMRDRLVHKVLPLPPVEGAQPKTGADLRAWLKRQGLTQRQGAKHLGVSIDTIKRAIAREGGLPPSMRRLPPTVWEGRA
jgi:hypothetical protein